MKLTKIILFSAMLCLSANIFAKENTRRGWQLDLQRLGLNLSSTNVTHAEDYGAFADARLTANNQTTVQGELNFKAEYFGKFYLWSNGLLAEYGKSSIEKPDGTKTTSETEDRIIVDTAYTLRLWNVENFLGGFEAGPYLLAAYETEFNRAGAAPLTKILRGEGGAKLFEGKYLKALYIAGLFEEDFTYPEHSTKLGWTAGFDIQFPIRDGVKAMFKGIWRDYLHESIDLPTDLDYSLELDARMEVLVWKNLSVAPFINYYTAQGKHVAARGQNVYMGISISFSKLFKEAKPVESAN